MPKALLIVDMLVDFVRPEGALAVPGAEAIVPAIAARLEAARRAGDLVVYACDAHDADDLEFQRYPPHAVAGSPGARVIEELAPLPHEAVVPKRRLSPFFQTGLDALLNRQHITSAVVTGVVTHICVMETASGLCDRDIAITIPLACVADFDQAMAQCAIQRMASVYGAEIIPSDQG